MEDKQEGILVPTRKEFYYLESNVYLKSISTQTISKTLTQRGIINVLGLDNKPVAALPHRPGMWAEAKELGYTAIPIHHNSHLKKTAASQTKPGKDSPWG